MIRGQTVYSDRRDVAAFLARTGSQGDKRPAIFLIGGRQSLAASGAEAELSQLLAEHRVIRFSDFSPNPKVEDVEQALALFRRHPIDLTVAAGGGSALDIGKLVAYFAATKSSPTEYFAGKRPNPIQPIPLLAIPTTAGSGSEATHFAVLYEGHTKHSIAHPALLPSHVWLNAAFTASLSAYQTACSGFDALAQAIESCWSLSSTAVSRQLSAEAIALCLRHLEPAVNNPTPADRLAMLQAANLAGQAINLTKTTAAHALSYALTSHYGLPHGHAVAMMLPAVFEANAAFTSDDLRDPRGPGHLRDTMQELSRQLGATSARHGADELRRLIARIHLSATWLTDHGFDPVEARRHIAAEVNQERLANNPRTFNPETLHQVLGAVR